jgi:DNA modification methylase
MTDSRPWPATTLELIPAKALVPFAGNARTHNEHQIETIADLMKQFGFTIPILRDESGTILAGHARLKAALLNLSRGHTAFANVPVVTAKGWSEEEKRAYVIADNQSALLAGWNFGVLASEVEALAGAGFDVLMLGFGDSELRKLTGYAAGLVDEDAAPALSDVPVSRTGDMWRLGQHRILCGDATSANDVGRLLDGAHPLLMVTDPPYGVEYDPEWRKAAGVSASTRMGAVANDDRFDWREAWALFPGDVAYVWHAGKFAAEVKQSLAACDFEIRSQIIWRKSRFAIGRSDYHWQHEPCWYAVRKSAASHWVGGRKQSTVWDIAGANAGADTDENAFTAHGTQKPVDCMRRPIENNSTSGDIVFDPFLGSGTTLIAAEQCERMCYGLEIDPRYVDVIVRGWQAFTGKQATLSDTGQSFEHVERERKQKSNGRERTKAKADRVAGSGRQQRKARAPAK